MKAFEVLKNIIEIIQKNLKITIYNTFSSNIIKLPIVEKFLTIEIYSGSKDKILITITAYAPQDQGAQACKDLTQKTIDILNSSKIENLDEVIMQNVLFNKAKKAYCQKCKVIFKHKKENLNLINFGNEEIATKQDLTLKFSRNISIYYSPLAGAQFKDLGRALRKVECTAIIDTKQFQRIADLILNKNINKLSIEGQNFSAMLIEMHRKTKNETFLSFLEVIWLNLKMQAFDEKNNAIALPTILWYEHYIGQFGFEETFKFGFSEFIPISVTKIIITKQNKKQIECFVDQISNEINKDGISSQIKVKNIVCRLFENQVAPETIKNFTLKKMLSKFAKEYDFKCKILNTDTIEMKNFYVDLGMTKLDVIKFFFRINCKKNIFLKDNKELVFKYSPSKPISFGNKKNLKNDQTTTIKYNSIKMLDVRSKLISDAFVKLTFEDNESEFFHLSEENVCASKCNIKRVKYCNIPTRWQIMPKSGSDYIVKKENKKRFKYYISTFENVEIFPGMICNIKEVGESKNLTAVEILESVTKYGTETKICLLNS